MMEFDFAQLTPFLPEVFLSVLALLLLVIGVYRKSEHAALGQIRLAIVSLVATGFVLYVRPEAASGDSFFSHFFVTNDFIVAVKYLLLSAAVGALLLALGYYRRFSQEVVPEFAVLILLSVLGMMIMVSSGHLLGLYLGIELQSLALYILASIHRENEKATEAGLKYFVLGAVSSGLLLYGISMIYGFSGTLLLSELSQVSMSLELLVGVILVLIAIFFKISAVPFHMWTPDVYQGAPTVVTAFFAVCPKIAAVSLLAILLIHGFAGLSAETSQIIMLVSALTMIVGALGAIAQRNIKRLIAFSSIGHVGFLLLALAMGSEEGVKAMFFYLVVYAVLSLGVFACILALRKAGEETYEIADYAGLAGRYPGYGLMMSIFMLSMAGLPPFAGFLAKFYVLYTAIEAELYVLSVIAILASVVSAFYYLRIIKVMYFDKAAQNVLRDFTTESRGVSFFSASFNVLLFLAVIPPVGMTIQKSYFPVVSEAASEETLCEEPPCEAPEESAQ